MEKIDKKEFDALSKEWTDLNLEYDNLFQEFLDHPHVKTPEDLDKFKAMQKRIYGIEDQLHKIAEGKLEIVA